FMWYEELHDYQPSRQQLTTQKEVDEYLDTFCTTLSEEQAKNCTKLPPQRISTGIYLQSIKFDSSTEINFTGYIWQVYDKNKYQGYKNEEIPVGFILPDAVESGSNPPPTVTHRIELEQENKEIIIWYVEATLKQKFNYSKYPFDKKVIWIRFWSPDFMRESILIPKLDSYQSTRKGDSFGYDEEIILGQWDLLETFFDYRRSSYNTNFDKYALGGFISDKPELYFNIVIQRHFTNSFVIYILPLLVIAGLAFSTLMMLTKDQDQASTYGINTSGVISTCSGLFFLVLLSQVHIRETFSNSKMVYIEHFYPVMYVALLGISLNSYVLSRKNTENNLYLKWINHEDNVIPKLIYWPALLGTITLTTAVFLLPNSKAVEVKTEGDANASKINNLKSYLNPSTTLSLNLPTINYQVSSPSRYSTLLPNWCINPNNDQDFSSISFS
ncbi:MAG: hypothetical protein AB4058_01290, partial [Microcystaceae cyanobacterium]